MQSKSVITVMIVTNHPIMREGLRLRVEQQPDMEVVCESDDPSQTLRDFRRCDPDVTLIDLQLPRGAGLQLMNAIRAISASTPLVMLANYPGEVDTSPRAGQGPTRVVYKNLASEQIILAIREVLGR
jgi:two-component system NarL family response regulator